MTAVSVVVMGVTGCGKTTIAKLLADRLGVGFAEGDSFHPQANVDKMSSGIPLGDEDRYPWLKTLAAWIREHPGDILTCSALKRHYRDILRTGGDHVFFVHLAGSKELIGGRMAARKGHYMPTSLLDSQFADLEPLGPGEAGVTLNVRFTPDELVRLALQALEDYHLSL